MKNYLFTIALLMISLLLNAQQTEKDAHYHFRQGNYKECIGIYEKLLEKDSSNQEFNYNLGVSYLNSGESPSKALHYLIKVKSTYENEAEFNLVLGRAYFYNYTFAAAKTYFEKFKNMTKDELAQEDMDLQLTMIENAKRLMAKPLDITFVNLGKDVNTEMSDDYPYMSPDGANLYYSNNSRYDRVYFYYYNNIYFAQFDNGEPKRAKMLSAINSMEDEFMAGLSLNGERVYAQLQGYEGFEDIFYTEIAGKSFRGKNPLGPNINTKDAEHAVYETYSGDTLYFSSSRAGGLGGMDLYYSLRLPTGEWSEPHNLGGIINSVYDEDYPVLSPNGNTLYFCSNNEASMGGFDIFKAQKKADGSFGTPVNIGYPLNSVFDDRTIAFSPDNRYAYVSAYREEGLGQRDIYQVIFNQEDPSVRIYMLQIKTGSTEQSVDFGEKGELKVVVLKGKTVYGEYAYNPKNSRVAIALSPGNYVVKITGDKVVEKEFKLEVPDTPVDQKIERRQVLLELK